MGHGSLAGRVRRFVGRRGPSSFATLHVFPSDVDPGAADFESNIEHERQVFPFADDQRIFVVRHGHLPGGSVGGVAQRANHRGASAKLWEHVGQCTGRGWEREIVVQKIFQSVGRPVVPYYFTKEDDKIIFFAAIYENNQFCIITREATERKSFFTVCLACLGE